MCFLNCKYTYYHQIWHMCRQQYKQDALSPHFIVWLTPRSGWRPIILLPMLSRMSLQWRHYQRDSVSNHQSDDCLFNCLLDQRSKKTPKLRVTGLCAGNSPVTGEFPVQRASNAENVSIWWRDHVMAWRPIRGKPHLSPNNDGNKLWTWCDIWLPS